MPAFEVKLNGVVEPGRSRADWWLGSGNVISVVVTAEDGGTTQTYYGDE